MCTTPFNPAPTTADAIIAAMSDPALALTDLAARYSTSVEALSLWLARHDISDRLDSLHSLAIARTRYIASTLLPKCINTLSSVLDAHAQLRANQVRGAGVRGADLPRVSTSSTSPTPQPPHQPTDPATRDAEAEALRSLGSPALTSSISAHPLSSLSAELLQRSAETARRAATRLLQLANFNPPRLFAPLRAQRLPLAPTQSQPAHEPMQRVAPAARPPVMSTERLQPVHAPSTRSSPPAAPPSPTPRTPVPIALVNPRSTLPSPLPRPFGKSRSPATLLQSAGSPLDLLLSTPNTHWP